MYSLAFAMKYLGSGKIKAGDQLIYFLGMNIWCINSQI